MHSFKDDLYEDGNSLLELECKFLSEKRGKVYKQEFGPVQTKDLYDAVSVITTDLLHEALERYDGAFLSAHSYGSSNARSLRSGTVNERAMELLSSRYQNGTQGTGKSWDDLRALQNDRARGRAAEAYVPSRLRSIERRERKQRPRQRWS